MAFLTTNPALARALAARDYTDPTRVQSAVLAPETKDRDLLVSAQTGSGKTVAYGLAMAETLLGIEERFGPAGAPLALVIAPTRELALQVQREFVWLFAETGARIVSCVGGMDPRQEQRRLAEGAHIVVGTPGRLRDHMERGRLDMSAIRVVVLDEADEMLDLGFREDLEVLLEATPSERRSLLFSATLPRGIATLAERYQRGALRIEVASAEGGHADIAYRAIRTAPKEVEHVVVNVLREHDAPSAIVFCNTREAVRHLTATLQERQFSAVALSGELSQNERNHALQALRDGRARVCVATDVAARGIDLPNLSLVIHAELPKDAETLQHRSGRTGRAGRKGVSVLLVPPFRRRRAQDLLAVAGVETQWSAPPTAEEIRALDQERMLRDPLLADAPGEDDLAAGQLLLSAYTAEHLAAALAQLYRSGLPVPEEVVDPGETRVKNERVRRPVEGTPMQWFRLNIGRRNNADPKWLLPLICRRGNVTRADIGVIRIFDNETAFEIGADATERFLAGLRKPGGEDVVIEPLAEAPSGRPTARPAPRTGMKPRGPRRDEAGSGTWDPQAERPHRAPRREAPHRAQETGEDSRRQVAADTAAPVRERSREARHEMPRQAPDEARFADKPPRGKPYRDSKGKSDRSAAPAGEWRGKSSHRGDEPRGEAKPFRKREEQGAAKPFRSGPREEGGTSAYRKARPAGDAPARPAAKPAGKGPGKAFGKPGGKGSGKPAGKPGKKPPRS
ncbi:DEAD/DEAH box helicase [Ancylobacter sp. 6x-1]|uniref:DEAD/DEAH box helicase n=1 Tax=Ancylobacter crimeensis TaxID=2579147 RepID=A0ABT0DE08_9HYPH|nr:DEAD/DEAH box helicase [Ancylobacter crimeensis]MCK0198203.1 DEAD/DEAH box helicase [Ancylobacter crimeensis]